MIRKLYSILGATPLCLAKSPLLAHSEKEGTTPIGGAQLTETQENDPHGL